MRVITEPKVAVVGLTDFLGHTKYRLPRVESKQFPGEISLTNEAGFIRMGAFAAKGCYDSFGVEGRSCEENQRQIIAYGHGSVLEHISVSLFIEGITRGCSLELNRHRHLAISQRSTRYTDEKDAAIVLNPYMASLPEKDLIRWAFENRAKSALETYKNLVAALTEENPKGLSGTELRKWARGIARDILPHCLETRGTYTANLRAWRHIIELRSERHAEAEIRRLSNHIFNALQEVAPLYFEDYKKEEVDGFYVYTTPNRKL